MQLDPTFIEIIGVLTLIFGVLMKAVGFPDQALKIHRSKSIENISILFIIFSFLSFLFWLLYGFLKNDYVIIIGQGIGVIPTGIILFQIFLYRKK